MCLSTEGRRAREILLQNDNSLCLACGEAIGGIMSGQLLKIKITKLSFLLQEISAGT